MLEFSCDRDYLSGRRNQNWKTIKKIVVSILLEYLVFCQVCWFSFLIDPLHTSEFTK